MSNIWQQTADTAVTTHSVITNKFRPWHLIPSLIGFDQLNKTTAPCSHSSICGCYRHNTNKITTTAFWNEYFNANTQLNWTGLVRNFLNLLLVNKPASCWNPAGNVIFTALYFHSIFLMLQYVIPISLSELSKTEARDH